METVKDRLMEITYEIYSKEHIISFEDFFDKIVNDEDVEIKEKPANAPKVFLKRKARQP